MSDSAAGDRPVGALLRLIAGFASGAHGRLGALTAKVGRCGLCIFFYSKTFSPMHQACTIARAGNGTLYACVITDITKINWRNLVRRSILRLSPLFSLKGNRFNPLQVERVFFCPRGKAKGTSGHPKCLAVGNFSHVHYWLLKICRTTIPADLYFGAKRTHPILLSWYQAAPSRAAPTVLRLIEEKYHGS
jgi:hypothetical protein